MFKIMKMKRKRSRSSMTILRNILCIFLLLLLIVVYKMKKIQYDYIKGQLYPSAVKFMEFEEQRYENTFQTDTLKQMIAKYNEEEKVLNLDIHGSVRPNGPVFVIFVGKYKSNLKFLITSLQHVVGIGDTLIIFSHSYFDENVNSLIKTIDFARVVPIFYPYSMQLYPKEFPIQPADCTGDTQYNARRQNCTRAKPDKYMRLRDPIVVQGKLFWWWTMNHIFKKLSHTKNHKGFFIFLNDDVFLMQDFIYMALQMRYISSLIVPCDFVSLHTSGLPDFTETKTHGANIRTWDPKEHSSVLAFDARVWDIISSHYYIFCNFDDHSWARTLYYMSLNRKDGIRFKVMSSTMPRAFTSSSHASGPFLEYNIVHNVHEILKMQKRNRDTLYPLQLEIFFDIELDDDLVSVDRVQGGYWIDPRDKMLCMKMTELKGRKKMMVYKKHMNEL